MKPPPIFDRSAHLRTDLNFLEAQLRADETLLVPVHGTQSLLQTGPDTVEVFMPTVGRAGALLDVGGELVWLGQLGERSCFAVDISAIDDPLDHPDISDEVESRDLRYVLSRVAAWQAQIAAYALAMLSWHRRHRFCGTCGTEARPRRGGHLRVCRAEQCGAEIFPRVDPAILVLVQCGDRYLLGRQAGWPAGMYSTLAGFVEPGETLEEAVAREVAEESGVHVTEVRYHGSQPWPFPGSLMVGFTATATDDRIVLADKELEHAAWFTAEQMRNPDLPGFFVPPPQSLSGELLAHYALNKEHQR